MTPLDCPVCRAPFREVLMDGVLIDVCTRCSGVWLDRGELERLLHRRRGPDGGGPAAPGNGASRRQ
jgi:Zn-finger nucleic acid-binding protein